MGLLRKYFYIFIIGLTFTGCTSNIFLVKSRIDENAYLMFGKTPQKTFYVPIDIADSLKLKWESGTRGAFTNSSVTVSDSIVFVNDLYGRVYAFNFNNGKKYGEIKNKGAVFTTPIVSGFWVVFVVSQEEDNLSTFIMYDYTKGKPFREVEVEGRVETQILRTPDGFVVTTLDGVVIKYDNFGIFLWKVKTNSAIRSNPTYFDGKIYFGNDAGEIISMNNSDGKIINTKKIGGKFRSGSSIEKNKLYIANMNSNLYCLSINSSEVIWEYKSSSRILMTPVIDNANIYFGNLGGYFYSIDKNSGKRNWEIKTDGLFNVTPLVTNNYLIVPDINKKILLINKKDGRTINKIELKGRPRLSPIIYKDILFIGYDRGNLQAYEVN